MLVVVARIVEKEKMNVLGYRLVDCAKVGADNAVLDVKTDILKNKIKDGLRVLNIGLDEKGEIKSTNGALDRYTAVDVKGTPLSNTSLVILFRAKQGFICSNYSGECSYIDNNKAVSIATKYGIANGKVTTRGSKKVISSIVGEYPEAPVEYKKREQEIILVSNEHSSEELFKRIRTAQKTKRIVGKLNAKSTDGVIRYAINKVGFLKAVESKDNEKIGEDCKVILKFLELVGRVGDKKTIITHATGLKAVKADLGTDKEDLFDRVMSLNKDKEVKFS